jgi:hypothetical protein
MVVKAAEADAEAKYLQGTGRGLYSFTSQLNLSRFGQTSTCPSV